jgi:Fur family ferric uptake transcriptional regulator
MVNMSDVATQLHSAGLKATAARRRVIALLAVAPRPLSHAEMEDRLEHEDGARLDRVTLYRVLDALVAAGLAMKAVDARGVSRFSTSDPQRAHHSHVHFRCTGCGGVFCLKAPPPIAPRLPRGFRLEAIEFDVSGICADCNRLSHERQPTQ